MYLSIRGTVYDITAGKAFYGPDGGSSIGGLSGCRVFAFTVAFEQRLTMLRFLLGPCMQHAAVARLSEAHVGDHTCS